jgi:hypothetical protein
MEYKIEIVERVRMTIHVWADSEEAALRHLDRGFAFQDVDTINWQTMSARVVEKIVEDSRRPLLNPTPALERLR